MQIEIKPGIYIAAVSGGVDSMVMLHLLTKLPQAHIIVAHVDHGIRPDSYKDRLFVQRTATEYRLPFFYTEVDLGADASESIARNARYHFLFSMLKEHGADAILTAHHLDDVLETAVLNLIRGTGRKGLTSLSSHPQLQRPMLEFAKKDIIFYAKANGLSWREDSTNGSDAYLRNYVRHQLLPHFAASDRRRLITIIDDMQRTNVLLDECLQELFDVQTSISIDRRMFTGLPHPIAKEFIVAWLRRNGITNFDAKTIERIVVKAKTSLPGRRIDVLGGATITVEKDTLALSS